jgi:hypothetical protein
MFKNSARTEQVTLPVSVKKTSLLPVVLFWKVISLYSEIRTDHVNMISGQNVRFLNFKLDIFIHVPLILLAIVQKKIKLDVA